MPKLKGEEVEFNKMVGNCLRYSRMNAGMSTGQIAERIGVTHQQVHKYERGDNNISLYRAFCWSMETNQDLFISISDGGVGEIKTNTVKLKMIRCFDSLPRQSQLALLNMARIMIGGGHE